MAGKTVSIAIAANAKPAVAAFDEAGSAAERMGAHVEESGRHVDEMGEKFGQANSKSTQLAGALGDVAGAFANSSDKAGILGKSVGNVASTIEGLSPFVMVAAGAFDILELAMNSNALASTRNAIAIGASKVAMIAGAAATGVMTAAQWALNVAMDANPVMLVVLAIAALVAGLAIAWHYSSSFRDAVIGGWNDIKEATSAAFGFVENYIGGVFHAIPEFFNDLLSLPGKMADLGLDIVHGIGDGINNALAWVKGRVEALGNLLPSWLQKVLGISSPSKVFAQIGRYSVEGFAAGFQSMSASEIVGPLSNALSSTSISAPSSSAVATLASVGTLASASSGQVVHNYQINVPDSATNPYLYGQRVQAALNALNRQGG